MWMSLREFSQEQDYQKIFSRRYYKYMEEVTARARIGSSRLNLKTRFNTPWKDSVDKSPKESSNNSKYKSADIIINCHILQRTTHVANTFPKRGIINEINIEKEPDVEKYNTNEDKSDDK
ncbi:hypothetical protein O181_061983 [Austropuccinia psidii MF-1]|uniref:Uncharacterized protein n=1 Tax=Austropuccinia psidii MF-1 TaxID=1389203 RepID=A0A9Q3ENW9_9BASI|nr:hypothetical protein [Austropuccinia psidii MF-1]